MQLTISLIASVLYAALGFHFARTRFTLNPRRCPLLRPTWEQVAIVVPLALHALALYHSMDIGAELNLGLGNAVSMMAFATIVIYWLGSFVYEVEGLQALMLPVAAVCVLLPAIFPESDDLAYAALPAFRIHLFISVLAYGLFTIAAAHALLMAFIERRLHRGAMPLMLQKLPLLTLENLLFRLIWLGFLLLTATVVSGVFFSEQMFGKPLEFNHKIVFALLSWGIFAALLAGRAIYGWRGRTAIRWTLSGFSMLALAYLGSKFVLEVILHRH
ncbi:MAG: cytochrome c biogenesis protein CcsA [Betaproteobacteria bacterium]|nr:cytochrome c biogenesis protein CcsA [Betaproteobacteria bacterium]